MKSGNKQRRDKFCRLIVTGMPHRQAYIEAGYSGKSAKGAVGQLLRNPAIKERIAGLQKRADDACIADVVERKKRLTEFIREDLVTDKGLPDRDTNIKAIEVMNKMERIYSDAQPANNDNRVMNIFVVDAEAKDLIAQVKERTQKLIEG